MFPKLFLLACASCSVILKFPAGYAQLSPEDVPPQLRFVLDPDLDNWISPEEIQKNFPYYLSGFDEENRPLWVIEMGIWPTHDTLAKGKYWEDACSKHVDQLIKRVYDSVKIRATPENPVKEINLIVDLADFTFRHISSVQAARFTTGKFQSVVEMAKYGNAVFAVNTNFFAEKVVNFLRPILGSALEKVEVYGTDTKTWIPKVLKAIPRDQLSARYSGDINFKPIKVYG